MEYGRLQIQHHNAIDDADRISSYRQGRGALVVTKEIKSEAVCTAEDLPSLQAS